MKELLARIKANIRRLERIEATTESDEVWKEGNLALYPSQMMVTRNGEPLSLSQREFDLIRYLWSHKNKVLSREELMEKVWSFSYYGDLRSVDVAMRRLREKLEDNPAVPVFLLTRRGAGYLFSTT
jgi:two-component system response regulator VicR